MRILHVITSLLMGGAEHLVVQLTERLMNKGCTVGVCLFDGEDTPFCQDLKKMGCEMYFLSQKRNFYNPLYILKLRKIMKDYDIIHTHNSSPQLSTAIANNLGCKKILVTTEHNTHNRKRSHFLLSRIDRWMYKQYSKIICISPKTQDLLCSYLSATEFNTGKICTISNGVDIKEFSNAEPNSQIRPSNRCIITMVGAFRPQKDQKTVIDALALLPQNQFQLWLIGDGELFEEVSKYAAKSPVHENIRFWGNRSDVPILLRTSDIIVMSSHWEGFGLAAVEGMAAKKPVVASDVDGLKQIVDGAGLIFKVGNAIDLSKKILDIYSTPEKYKLIADKCFSRALEFDISKMVNEYYSLYQELIYNETR